MGFQRLGYRVSGRLTPPCRCYKPIHVIAGSKPAASRSFDFSLGFSRVAMYRLIMVCTGNICRSPMAEGLVRFLLPPTLRERVEVGSAGVAALHGNPAQPFAVEVMARKGIDIRSHRARQMTGDLARRSDLVLTMEGMQQEMVRRMLLWKKNKIRLLSEFCPQPHDPDIADPYGGPIEAYEDCYHTLFSCITRLIDWIPTQEAATDHPP
jgi:protein-tyrosine phosphatase